MSLTIYREVFLLRWTPGEDQAVQECVKQAIADGRTVSSGVRDASRQIDRPFVHVLTRWYQRLRFEAPPRPDQARTNPRNWTKEEERAVREAVAAARSAGVSERSAVKAVAGQIGRSYGAVAQHLAIMRAGGLL